ncbi:hypothetical protein AGDE_15126 [Angomonas deanei]|nr:hypothetical protein AGDE_15126 [Angomonas deanei]|eukprot:EPY19678.1 hypothetical protein AGDE_15126 [Angomonas deanei]
MKGSSSIMKKTSSFARPKAGIAPSSPSPLESIPQSISPNGSMSLKTSLPPSVDESSLTASIKGPSLDPPRRRETMAKKESIKPLNSFKLPDDDE